MAIYFAKSTNENKGFVLVQKVWALLVGASNTNKNTSKTSILVFEAAHWQVQHTNHFFSKGEGKFPCDILL